MNQYENLTRKTFRGSTPKMSWKSRPKRKPPCTASFSRACCQTMKSVEPGLYSHRSTFVVRNDFTLKSGSPTSVAAEAAASGVKRRAYDGSRPSNSSLNRS